jgi:hypothetical protein
MNELKLEAPLNGVKKVKIKNDQLTVEYTEKFADANYSNNVTKESEQYVHSDLKYAFGLLKPHVAAICEMPEAKKINVSEPSETDLNVTLDKIIVTGYSKGGTNENAGVCITAQRILKTGQILNITTPFTKFQDETVDGYGYGNELWQTVNRCDYEVDAYLFEGKWGIKQLSLDFDTPEGETAAATEEKPKKRGRKKKAASQEFEDLNPSGFIADVEFEEENEKDVNEVWPKWKQQ